MSIFESMRHVAKQVTADTIAGRSPAPLGGTRPLAIIIFKMRHIYIYFLVFTLCSCFNTNTDRETSENIKDAITIQEEPINAELRVKLDSMRDCIPLPSDTIVDGMLIRFKRSHNLKSKNLSKGTYRGKFKYVDNYDSILIHLYELDSLKLISMLHEDSVFVIKTLSNSTFKIDNEFFYYIGYGDEFKKCKILRYYPELRLFYLKKLDKPVGEELYVKFESFITLGFSTKRNFTGREIVSNDAKKWIISDCDEDNGDFGIEIGEYDSLELKTLLDLHYNCWGAQTLGWSNDSSVIIKRISYSCCGGGYDVKDTIKIIITKIKE